MNRSCLIVIYFLVTALLFFSQSGCGSKSTADNKKNTTSIDTLKTKTMQNDSNVYEEMRNMALNITAEQLELPMPGDATIVYGVVMDWELGDGISTTACYATGDASMYLSTGGGVIGGGKHQNVNAAAKKLVASAQKLLDKTVKTGQTPLPGTDEVHFYFITNKGIFIAKEHMANFENEKSPWFPFFEEVNLVITELRKSNDEYGK